MGCDCVDDQEGQEESASVLRYNERGGCGTRLYVQTALILQQERTVRNREELMKVARLIPAEEDCVALAVAMLMELSEDQRCRVFTYFCVHCGSDDPTCQCWNDE